MSTQQLHAVTGAFGYSGQYITRKLLAAGHKVRTLTNSPPHPDLFDYPIETHPLAFEDPSALARSLQGVDVLHNTYWVRFNYKTFTHAAAVRNTLALFNAAKAAGVRRIIHISITNPFEDSPLSYFRGKAQLERALRELGVSHCILRPAVLFGQEDILINNIAWLLRRSPIFGLFGRGDYHLQPIYVDDLADLALQQSQLSENMILNAIGPETFTYRQLVQTIARIISVTRLIIPMPPSLAYGIGWIASKFLGDVLITRDEIHGLMADLLHVNTPPTGTTRLTDWAREHADTLGLHYASELARRRV